MAKKTKNQAPKTEETPKTAEAPKAEPAKKESPKAEAPRTEKAKKAKPEGKKVSALDAAAKVLGESGQPMTCQEMITAMGAKGYWSSPGGQTPAATLYSAILRELKTKTKDARFVKTERGKFALVR